MWLIKECPRNGYRAIGVGNPLSAGQARLILPKGFSLVGRDIAATVFFLFTNGAQIKILTQ
jgi:hypothetical protein